MIVEGRLEQMTLLTLSLRHCALCTPINLIPIKILKKSEEFARILAKTTPMIPGRRTVHMRSLDRSSRLGGTVHQVKGSVQCGISQDILDRPLSFFPNIPKHPMNRPKALKQAIIDKSLKKYPVKKQHFVAFIQKVIDSGAAKLALPVLESNKCWYSPLFWGIMYQIVFRAVFGSSPGYDGASFTVNR